MNLLVFHLFWNEEDNFKGGVFGVSRDQIMMG